MELSPLLHDLHLSSSSSSEKTRPSIPLPPITELLSELQKKLISVAERSDLIGQVERLFQAADPDWLFPPLLDDQDSRWAELQAEYSSMISALIGCAALPLCEEDCGSLDPSAYQSVPKRAAAVSSALTALLGNWEEGGGARRARLLLAVAPPIYLFAVTHFQDEVWTSAASRTAARHLQVALLRAGGWRDSAHLLAGEEEEDRCILGGVLDILQPQLTRESWRRCAALKLQFSWTLLQVTRPFLSPFLPRLLPPSLLLNDDYKPENCMLGVRCLHHIVLNTPAADLRQFNRAEVLYQALFRHLYTSEAAVIQLVLSCLLDLLLVLEKPPSSDCRRTLCRHDDVLHLVLTHMEAEHKVALRRVYASALPLYVERVGVAVCRHLRRLLPVLLGYLEVGDPPEESVRLKMLEVLQSTIRLAWPRMASRTNVLLRCLLRLLVDVSADPGLSDSVRLQLMEGSSASLRLLDAATQQRVQVSLFAAAPPAGQQPPLQHSGSLLPGNRDSREKAHLKHLEGELSETEQHQHLNQAAAKSEGRPTRTRGWGLTSCWVFRVKRFREQGSDQFWGLI
ncbi:TELO2-interacting protein 2 isoform X4 [Xiphophorus couchianus]|nr:TELO2-interacting protein 2 isoform X4 [Xiphophorus couchianus]XP_027872921.1 TELO2-interacting protein 2 isoform X4 [Xiphophorus couchianus]